MQPTAQAVGLEDDAASPGRSERDGVTLDSALSVLEGSSRLFCPTRGPGPRRGYCRPRRKRCVLLSIDKLIETDIDQSILGGEPSVNRIHNLAWTLRGRLPASA